MPEIPEAYIYDAIRTPRGRGKASGALHEVKPVSLVVGLIDELRRRYPSSTPATIDDVVLGVVSPIGDQGGDIAKTAAHRRRPARHGRRRPAQPLLRLRPGGREHRRPEGPLRHGGAGPGRRRRGDEPRADGLRRRRLGDGPGDSYTTGFVPQGIGADLIATLEGFSRERRGHVRRRVADPRRQGLGERLLLPVRRAGQGPQRPDRARPRRARPRRRDAGEPGRAQAVVRDDGRRGWLRRRRPAALPLGREDRPRAPRRATRPASSTARRSR